jgi:hypothetical protein
MIASLGQARLFHAGPHRKPTGEADKGPRRGNHKAGRLGQQPAHTSSQPHPEKSTLQPPPSPVAELLYNSFSSMQGLPLLPSSPDGSFLSPWGGDPRSHHDIYPKALF